GFRRPLCGLDKGLPALKPLAAGVAAPGNGPVHAVSRVCLRQRCGSRPAAVAARRLPRFSGLSRSARGWTYSAKMKALRQVEKDELEALSSLRELADQAFSRAAGAPVVGGNHVSLLRDAEENYPAWLAAIRAARRHIHFETYIFYDDDTGREFADA